jgi:hypothetical protein
MDLVRLALERAVTATDAVAVITGLLERHGQGGTGHINEQPPSYWADLFAKRDYRVTGALRWLFWNDDGVENWYSQNLFLATPDWRAPRVRDLYEHPMAEPIYVIHPVLWEARR